MNPAGKVAIVTGRGRGSAGRRPWRSWPRVIHVALAGRRPEALEETVARAGPDGTRALAVPTDVTDPSSVRAAVRADRPGLRPPRRPVQQRRVGCARGPARGPLDRGLAKGG